MGFSVLRVLNEDRVQPGKGFPTHSHRDMEIVLYVLEGALEHKDSLGTGAVIHPSEVQRMNASTGVTHSEFNASHRDPVHFLQIWILPERTGLPPSYEQRAFPDDEKPGRLFLIASRYGREGSITIHQDVALCALLLAAGARVQHALAPSRHAWVHIARGALTLNNLPLVTGDGAAVTDETLLTLTATDQAEVLLFDLP